MSRPDIDAIKARLGKATPGYPWYIDPERPLLVAAKYDGDRPVAVAETYQNSGGDAELIVNAPTDLAALIAYVMDMEAQLETITKENSDLRERAEKAEADAKHYIKVVKSCEADYRDKIAASESARQQAEAERDQAQADAAAMREALEHYAGSDCHRYDKWLGYGTCLDERPDSLCDSCAARKALATNAGSALTAELMRLREIERLARVTVDNNLNLPEWSRAKHDLRTALGVPEYERHPEDSSARSLPAKVEADLPAVAGTAALTAPTELQSEAEKAHEIARETRRLAVLFHMNPNEDNLARLRYQLDRTVGLAERAEAERGNG